MVLGPAQGESRTLWCFFLLPLSRESGTLKCAMPALTAQTSGEATMYPKPSEEIRSVKLKTMAIGHKHVVITTTDDIIYTMGSSPCYGELGYGDGLMRSSTSFKAVGPLDAVPAFCVAAG